MLSHYFGLERLGTNKQPPTTYFFVFHSSYDFICLGWFTGHAFCCVFKNLIHWVYFLLPIFFFRILLFLVYFSFHFSPWHCILRCWLFLSGSRWIFLFQTSVFCVLVEIMDHFWKQTFEFWTRHFIYSNIFKLVVEKLGSLGGIILPYFFMFLCVAFCVSIHVDMFLSFIRISSQRVSRSCRLFSHCQSEERKQTVATATTGNWIRCRRSSKADWSSLTQYRWP